MCIIALGVGLGALVGARLAGRDCLLIGGMLLLLFAFSLKLGKRGPLLLFLFAALTLLRIGLAEQDAPPLGQHALSGTVAAEPTANGYGGYTVLLRDIRIDGDACGGRVRAYIDPVLPPVPGQRVGFAARLRAPDVRAAAYYRYLGVTALADAVDDAYRFSEPPGGMAGVRNRVRQSLRTRIHALFPQNGALIAAFLIGDGRDVTEETHTVFRAAGVSHLLAISGLHVSILAAAVRFPLRVPGRWLRFALLFAFLLGYCALTFFRPSVVRASVMFLCASLAEPLRRNPDGASALAAAFAVVVLANPFAVGYVGFQLSFLAAYGLVTLGPVLRSAMRRLGSGAAGTISGTLAATASTLPSVCRFFGSVPVSGIAVNVLVLPLFAAVLVPAFAAVAVSYLLLAPGQWLAAAVDHVLGRLLLVIDACAGAQVAVAAPGLPAMALWLLALLAASKYPMLHGKTRAICALSLSVCALLVWRI